MITIDWLNKIVNSTSDILDLPAFKDTIRDLEDDAEGIIYPAVISYKRIDLGGGGYFHAVDLINGYQLKFPIPGSYIINGNLGGTIIPVAGVYVERKTSAAFATSSSGGAGAAPTVQEIRQEIDNNSIKLNEIYKILGLDIDNPLVITPDSRVADAIELEITGDKKTLTIVTRK